MTTEMTISRSLAELKLLDKRINRTINGASFGGLTVGKKVSAGFNNVEEIENRAKSDLQSIQDLIKRRNAIKSAIVVSNATTEVVIAGVKMSVAEAIERKSSIVYEEGLLSKLKNTYTGLTSQVDQVNAEMQQRLDRHLETLFGKEGKITAQANDDIVLAFKKDNEAKLIDSIDLKKQIDKLTESIEDFENEVDFALNESNVLTKITLED